MSSIIYSIYKATNKINGKHYIGFDSAWPKRKKSHVNESHQTNHRTYNTHFHRAIRKYGIGAFEWNVIYQSKNGVHCLREMEPYFIKQYDSFGINGYNMTLGGEGSLGRYCSDKTKNKISNLKKGTIPKSVLKHMKSYEITTPNQKIIITNNLTSFCKNNNLCRRNMIGVSKGARKHHKGWKCSRL